jgi:hypothetical protein
LDDSWPSGKARHAGTATGTTEAATLAGRLAQHLAWWRKTTMNPAADPRSALAWLAGRKRHFHAEILRIGASSMPLEEKLKTAHIESLEYLVRVDHVIREIGASLELDARKSEAERVCDALWSLYDNFEVAA